MGFWSWICGVLEWLGLKNKRGKLLLLGLDNAGKTTLLQCLKTGYFVHHEQTKTYQRDDLRIEGVLFQAFDLGGHELARQSWSDYYASTDCVVFMVDASDTSRFPEVRTTLSALLTDDSLKSVPFLILGNKIDKQEAVSVEQLGFELGIPAIQSQSHDQRCIKLCMSSVKLKTGYADGFRWLAKFL